MNLYSLHFELGEILFALFCLYFVFVFWLKIQLRNINQKRQTQKKHYLRPFPFYVRKKYCQGYKNGRSSGFTVYTFDEIINGVDRQGSPVRNYVDRSYWS
jgi:hypothetical protein